MATDDPIIDLPVGGPCDLASDAGDLEDELDSYLSIGEASATEVVYVREHVCVWPSRKERIPGRLSLVKQHCVLFMSWLPYGDGVLHDDGTYQSDANQSSGGAGSTAPPASGPTKSASSDRSLYAIHPLNLTEVRLLRALTPRMGPHRLDVTLISGVTLSPLHLPAAAIDQFIRVIQQHVSLIPSASMKGTWLVNETPDPLIRSLTALELGDVMLGGPPRGGAQLTWAPPVPPEPTPGVMSTSWAQWIANSETVWDVFNGSSDPLAHTPHTHTSHMGAAVSGSVRGLADLGRNAWRALSTGLQRLVADFPDPTDTLHDPYTDDTDVDPGKQRMNSNSAEVSSPQGDAGQQQQGDGDVGTSSTSTGTNGPEARLGKSVGPNHRASGSGNSGVVASGKGKVGGGGGASGSDGLVRWQTADGLGSGQRAARAACMAVGTLATGLGALSPDDTPTKGSGSTSTDPSDKGAHDSPNKGSSGQGTAAKQAKNGTGNSSGSSKGSGSGKGYSKAGSTSSTSSTQIEEEYEMVERNIQTLCEAHLRAAPPPPLTEEDLTALADPEGRLPLSTLRERCWVSGLTHPARRTAWPLLLGLRKPSHTDEQYKTVVEERKHSYSALCRQWQARIRTQDPSKDRAWWESCSRIDKDVGRTDRAHPAFATDGCAAAKALRRILLSYVTQPGATEYCQGMSDLAAPLLVVFVSESEAFAAFNTLMSRVGGNFDAEQKGMHAQLAALRRIIQLVDPPLHAHLDACDCLSYFFTFRWLLILFKREFRYDDVLRLWEALWCAPTGPHMHLYVAAAVLVHHRKAILTQVHDFDGMLKFCIHLSHGDNRLELQPLLVLAHALATCVGTAADEVLPQLPPLPAAGCSTPATGSPVKSQQAGAKTPAATKTEGRR